jgi:hypothetical protein
MTRTLLAIVSASMLASIAAAQPLAPPTQVSGQTSLWRASKVIGVTVYNGANDKIGQITDLIMDREGQVKEVVISVGGFDGEHLIAVTLDVLRFPHRVVTGTAPTDPENDRWFPEQAVLATSKETLLALPEFKY